MPRTPTQGYAQLTLRSHARVATCLRSGVTRGQLRAQIRSGRWSRPFRGVVVETERMTDQWTLVRAALDLLGDRAVVGDETAARLWGFAAPQPLPVHLLVPTRTRTRSRRGIVLRRASWEPDDVEYLRDVPCTRPERTAIDLARLRRREEALAILDASLRSRLVTRASLDAELERHGGSRGVREVRSLLGIASHKAESAMESILRLRVVDGGLPVPEPQVIVDEAGCRVDLGYREFRVALEFASRTHHESWDAVRGDKQRDRRLSRAGWLVLHFTAGEVWNSPEKVVAEIAAALRNRGWDGNTPGASPSLDSPDGP